MKIAATIIGLFIVLALAIAGSVKADGPFLWVRSGTDAVAGNAFNFVFDSADTIPFNIDQAGMVLRNADTQDGNYAYYCFQSNDTNGVRYHAACIRAVYKHHLAGGDRLTEMVFSVRGGNGALTDALSLYIDPTQGGITLALGTLGNRQGFNLGCRLPLAFSNDANERHASIKAVCEKPQTIQLGDNFGDNGTDTTLRAPNVAAGYRDKTGGNLVIEAGTGTGLGAGGCIEFATAPPISVSSVSPNAAVIVGKICGDDLIMNGVSFKSLEARIASLEARP